MNTIYNGLSPQEALTQLGLPSFNKNDKNTILPRQSGIIPIGNQELYLIRNLFINNQNSCYLDSLLIVMFANISGTWINGILIKSYKEDEIKNVNCNGILLSNYDSWKFSGIVKDNLISLFKILIQKKEYPNLTCNSLRNILSGCFSDIMQNKSYSIYNPSIIYDHLTDLFPYLKIRVPYITINNKYEEEVSYFTMWDFMEYDGTESFQDAPKKYLWNDIDSDFLVFTYTGIPPITSFNEIGSELISLTLNNNISSQYITKKQAFGEIILNKYRLTGIITLIGYIPGTESGKHYITYYVGRDNLYYKYDDLKGYSEHIPHFPLDGVFKYSNQMIPQMYFYAKIKF